MRRKTILVILIFAALLILVVPVGAAKPERVGTQLSIFPGVEDTTFPAGEPFHIVHGWGVTRPKQPLGRFDFELTVDGVYRKQDFVDRWVDTSPGEAPFKVEVWVHNFPEGMTGTHEFRGEWLAPCRYAVENGLYPGPCATPNEKVIVISNTVEVLFEE